MWFSLPPTKSAPWKQPLGVLSTIAALTIVFAALSSAAGADGPLCVTDDAGRGVCLPAPPQRVVSFAPSLTATAFELGAGHVIVGRTLRCNEPAEAIRVPEIGSYMNPDLERVIALKPDLVLAPKSGTRKELIVRLTSLDIPVYIDDSETLEQVLALVRRLGVLLGREARAEEVMRELTIRRTAVRDCVGKDRQPTVVFAVGVRPLVVAGGKSFIGSLIREAGGINIAEDESIAYPKFSIEEVVRKDPDIILVVTKECRDRECVELWKQHRALRAVRQTRVYALDPDLLTRPCPRIVLGLEQLAAILHPNRCRSARFTTESGRSQRLGGSDIIDMQPFSGAGDQ